jgi:hypothetical protein
MIYILLFLIILIFIITIIFIKCCNKSNFENITRKNLLFTSVGNNTDFYKNWLGSNRNYDVWVVYYDDNQQNYEKYQSMVDRLWSFKGSKFQNFHTIYKDYYNDLMNYDRFLIIDDDIIMSTEDINNLFLISEQFGLSICQPGFIKGKSKISHNITTSEPNVFLKYTNFVEVNTPLFNKKSLLNLMKYYDRSLIGWGIDYLYIWANNMNSKDKFAVIDSIQCINPYDVKKNNTRELTKIKNYDQRVKYWSIFALKHKIPISWPLKIYKKILKPE